MSLHPTFEEILDICRPDYFEQMQAHVDEGGRLSHQNGVDLLAELARREGANREYGQFDYDQKVTVEVSISDVIAITCALMDSQEIIRQRGFDLVADGPAEELKCRWRKATAAVMTIVPR